jgi:hypothetical protein
LPIYDVFSFPRHHNFRSISPMTYDNFLLGDSSDDFVHTVTPVLAQSLWGQVMQSPFPTLRLASPHPLRGMVTAAEYECIL